MKKTLFLALLPLILASCNENLDGTPESTGDSQGLQAGNGNAPVSCPDAWSRFVAANPVGRFEKYSIETQTKEGGTISFPGRRLFKTRVVTSASPEAVLIRESFAGRESTVGTNRDEFIKNCNRGVPGELNPDFDVRILEQGTKAIRVPFGSFNCYYVKENLLRKIPDSSQGDLMMESYTEGTDGYGFTVKSILTLTGRNLVQTTIEELVERK